jgi:hypothetical protein
MGIDAKTTLTTALAVAALVLAGPAHAYAVEPVISQQPVDTARTQLAEMSWVGGSASQHVFVEYRYGLQWIAMARDGAEHVVLTDEGDSVWSARWLPTRYSPSGTYRIRVEGPGYTLVSDEFGVAPCDCVVPDPLKVRWRKGAFRLRLTAEYQPLTMAGFQLLPLAVETGRPLVRVLRDGRRVGSVRLRYVRGVFKGIWPGPRGPRHSVVFRLVSLTDGFGNR